MKSLFFWGAMLFAIFLQSCSNELDVVDSSSTRDLRNNYVISDEVVVVNNGETLQFRDQAAFERIKSKLMFASDQERLAFADSLGFQSLFTILNKADQELDKIVNECSSVEEFSTLYNQYKSKYASLFAFNTPDSEELFPYLLLEDPIEAYYTGVGKNVIVGNREISNEYVSSVQSYNQTAHNIVLAEETAVNDGGVRYDKRKVGLHMRGSHEKDNLDPYGVIYRDFVYANFTAQKKNMFGWVRYSTEYNAIFNLGDFYVRALTPQNYLQDIHVNGVFYFNTEYRDHVRIANGEQSGNWTVCLGYSNGICKGNVKFWSRGIAEEHAAYMNVYLTFN